MGLAAANALSPPHSRKGAGLLRVVFAIAGGERLSRRGVRRAGCQLLSTGSRTSAQFPFLGFAAVGARGAYAVLPGGVTGVAGRVNARGDAVATGQVRGPAINGFHDLFADSRRRTFAKVIVFVGVVFILVSFGVHATARAEREFELHGAVVALPAGLQIVLLFAIALGGGLVGADLREADTCRALDRAGFEGPGDTLYINVEFTFIRFGDTGGAHHFFGAASAEEHQSHQ